MSSQENPASAQLKVMQEWRRGFQTKDMDLIAKFLHKDYRHRTYPQSLGMPEQTKEEWLEFLARDFDHWTDAQASLTRYSSNLPSLELTCSHSRPSIPSRRLRARSSFTFVVQNFRLIPHLLTWPAFLVHHQGENHTRVWGDPRIDHHRANCYRWRRQSENQTDRRVYRLQGPFRHYPANFGCESQEVGLEYACMSALWNVHNCCFSVLHFIWKQNYSPETISPHRHSIFNP